MTPHSSDEARHPHWRLTALMALAAIVYWSLFAVFPRLLWSVGVHEYRWWFLDSYALLASNDAMSAGLNPYLPNPLDYFHRPHVYPHWWLHLRDLGLTRADVTWVSLALIGGWLVAVGSRLRPREPRQLLFYLALLCSSPVLLAVNRANNDLVIFILFTPLVPALLDPRQWVRYAAILLIVVATALKYYPAVAALLVLVAAPARELRWRVALVAGLLALVAYDLAPELHLFGRIAPHPDGLMTFGATEAFTWFGWTGAGPKLLTLALGAGAWLWWWRSPRLAGWTPRAEQQVDWLHFVLGAVLLTGCFFAGTNYGYRWIFALWLAPLLWSLPADAAAPAAVRRLARVTRALLLAAVWLDALDCFVLNRFVGAATWPTLNLWADRLFRAEQPLVWAFFVCLLAFLAHFTRTGLRALAGR